MQALYSKALWKPLGNTSTEPYIGVPRVLIFHTMSGFLAGSDSWFRRGGYDGTESHFGVGGTWDKGLDGVVYQWQRLDRGADAQYGANAYATSIETSDGAKSNVPWGDAQLAALVELATWWCLQTRNPARLVSAPTERGFGYHQQFAVWNKSAHACPGPARVHQLKTVIIPRVCRALNQPPGPLPAPEVATPAHYRPEDGDGLLELWEKDTGTGTAIITAQRTLANLGYLTAADVDGYFGVKTRTAVVELQTELGLDPDGVIGPKTSTGMRGAAPKPKAPWPLPVGDWFGPPDPDPRNQSGYQVAKWRPHIKRIQRAVATDADGWYGEGTAKAVSSWQKAHDLKTTGRVDRPVWRRLFPE